jgi:transcriptional regulator with XRE-family HTH domain
MDEGGRLAGQRPAAARRRKGLSQLQLADMIGRSESWVSKVETGVLRLDRLALARLIARLLGMDLAYLLGLDAPAAAGGFVPAQERTLKLVHLLAGPRDWEMWDDVKRRWFFVQAAGSVMAVLDVLRSRPAAELGDRVEAVRAGCCRIDDDTIEGLAHVTLGYRQAYRSVSAFSLLGPACGTLSLLTGLAPDSGGERDRVVSMIGEMGALIATVLTLDMEDFAAARPYLGIAMRAAQQSGSRELMAFTLGGRAFHAAYSGDVKAGLGFVQGALDVAARGIHPRTHGWLSAVASEMVASQPGAAGQRDLRCERLLETAARQLRHPALGDEPWLGIGAFNADKLTAYRGGDLMRLGRYREAQAELLAALDRLDPALRRHRCTAHVDLADAYVRDGKIDDGAGHAIRALEIIEDTRHAGSLRRVETLHKRIRPARSQAARQLGERLLHLKAAS